jgi:predicted alpha/beta superfamily hydrolase
MKALIDECWLCYPKTMQTINIQVAGYQIALFKGSLDLPTVYFHGPLEEATNIYRLLTQKPNFVAITNNDWESDFTPFKHSKVFKWGHDFSGNADKYIEILTQEIIPKAEGELDISNPDRVIAGYSLAGLLALYVTYKTPFFNQVACISGSLWYPGFMEYQEKNEPRIVPKSIYFSLGDKESLTKNPYLSKALECMQKTKELFKKRGSKTFFELNQGGHFIDSDIRTLKGLNYLLKNS